MVLVTELEEDETVSQLNSGTKPSATGIVHNMEEEENDKELDGFETASEGSNSDDDGDDVEVSNDRLKREIDESDAKEIGHDLQTGVEEVENKLRQVAVTEEQPQSDNEENSEAQRQERIDEAVNAKLEGNSLFAEARYVEALSSYDRGLSACPLIKDVDDPGVKEIRAVLHANRAACYTNLENNDSAVKECTKALELNPNYLKVLVRRYQAREKLTLYDEAVEDVKKILELDPGNAQARFALRRITPLAEEKREKLKNEMMDKLKEAGNSLLGRFGMSLDNFKAVQDPATGSYSINFQR